MIGRRDFITLIGGAAAWPLPARAQQDRMRRIGLLIAFPENNPLAQQILAAFVESLRSLGWVERKNIQIDYRFASGDPVLFKTFGAELVGLSPDAF
jgi:putative tryptophan/tyrosine transport system substrate-binding protein